MARYIADEHSGLPAILRTSMRLILDEIRLMEARMAQLEAQPQDRRVTPCLLPPSGEQSVQILRPQKRDKQKARPPITLLVTRLFVITSHAEFFFNMVT